MVGDRRDPPAGLGPHPEGVAGSVGAVDEIPGPGSGRQRDLGPAVRTPHRGHRSQAQEALQAAPVEARNDLVVDHHDGDGHPPGLRHQLCSRPLILGDVLGGERDPVRRKKLFRRVAGLSGRGPVHRDLMRRHRRHSCGGRRLMSRSSPKMCWPSLKASMTGVPAPTISGCVAYQARRCSSDRKKLRVVQRNVQRRPASSPCWPTQTMSSAAVGSGPVASAEKISGSPQ